ncbi:hypothetical protein Tco_0205691 [Tanacetum coccineum]|uniref:Uncharacterized protein n=1 Tax=Tanacetum coccineum TaxID=301880 RepID=A0ABQ5GV55_9ASTR
MSQSIPEQLNVDRREFADAVNALTKFVFLKYQLKCVPPILTLWNMLEEMPVECHLTLKGTRKRLGTVCPNDIKMRTRPELIERPSFEA